MQKKAKIILALIIGVIIIIPTLFLTLVFLISSYSKTADRTNSYYPSASTMSDTDIRSGGFAAQGESISSKLVANDMLAGDTTNDKTATETDQKIIKTGYLDIVIDRVGETMTKLTALTTGKGGYLQNSSVSERKDGTKYGSATIRIPAKEFENTMEEVKKLATSVTTETSSGQDVTEEYTDLEAQLHNAQAQETEYLNILKKATSVDDILNVQSYLGRVREQIETLQGRIKYLSNLTTYSTITVSLSEEPTIKLPTKEFHPWSAIKEAAQTLVSVAQALVITIIWLMILGGGILLPAIILLVILIWVVKRLWRRIYAKK
jgi:hypothetical protein